ncbi:CBS domain-containing protein [Pararhodobacter oceanensis]|uniref:Histidine kinase n=1 Tax=Pararhodobacter oceanensis TaxID=2172121 RepID=A0A2T8HRJ8_9RHOB|nr:CBS domain-containing protein [Pararhodobacter oceanensis]PVH27972.1 histidine kinase [Pararhodobacter oceanensis]
MLVSQILKNKAQGVLTVSPDSIVKDAVDLLTNKRIGAVVVSETGKDVKGILSERDIVRELCRAGDVTLKDRVENLMTRAVTGCAPSDTIESVLETMTNKRFRHMPVVENNEMVGFISIGDVVAAQLSELRMEKDALTGMIMGN